MHKAARGCPRAPRDRRVDPADDGRSRPPRAARATSRRTRSCTAGSVITPRPRDDLGASGLELRLDQQHQSGRRDAARRAAAPSTRVSEMNDRSATTTSTGPPMLAGVASRTWKRSSTVHPRVVADARVELTVADVDGHHLRGAALQQAVGEPAGRRAGVEHPPAVDVDGERVERGVELVAATADEARRRAAAARSRHRGARAAPPCRRALR